MNNKDKKFDIHKYVYDYKTKNKYGFNPIELEDLIKKFPFEIDQEKYDIAMMGNTCMMEKNMLIIYPCDVVTALTCGSEGRNMHWWEFD